MTISTDRVSDEMLATTVSGTNLKPGTLADQFSETERTLFVFLRHFGCVFCREMVRDLAQFRVGHADFPELLFVHMGTPAEGDAFFAKYGDGLRAIADPEKVLYQGFGLRRGGLKQMFGPNVWKRGFEATFKGHGVGRPIGDPWQMPGAFLIEGRTILAHHDFDHAGDHPDWLAFVRPEAVAV